MKLFESGPQTSQKSEFDQTENQKNSQEVGHSFLATCLWFAFSVREDNINKRDVWLEWAGTGAGACVLDGGVPIVRPPITPTFGAMWLRTNAPASAAKIDSSSFHAATVSYSLLACYSADATWFQQVIGSTQRGFAAILVVTGVYWKAYWPSIMIISRKVIFNIRH